MNTKQTLLVVALTLSGSGVGASAWSGAALAQGYGGVVPGSNAVPGSVASSPATAGAQVTWPGFQVLEDGGTRVFVQTNVAVQPELKKDGQNWLVVIPGVSLPKGNARLPLDTHFFNTPVTSARMQPLHSAGKRRRKHQVGTGVTVLLEMRAPVTPKLRTEKAPNGYFFTYIEFAAGKYN
ncbi:MAG: hypothetical protein QM778_09420 [Myxococcales bacterium]